MNIRELVDDKSPYKYRYPKIFLIGNPKKLGYDPNSQEWCDLASYTINLIDFNEEMPIGLAIGWWYKGTFYVHEAPIGNIHFDRQGYYNEFQRMMYHDQKELFKFSPPITKYGIPTRQTVQYCRLMWSVNLWKNIREVAKELNKESVRFIESYNNELRRTISKFPS